MGSLNFLLSGNLLRAIIVPVLLLSNIHSYSKETEDTLPWQQPKGPCVLPWPPNIPISIFDTSVSNEPVNYIVQDAIENNLFIGIVIDDSPLRFKIKYYIPVFTEGWYSEGWVDKSNLAICPEVSDTENGKHYVLYDSPLKDTFKIVRLNDTPVMLQPLEFRKQESSDNQYIVKVVIETADGTMTGWLDHYMLPYPTFTTNE